MAKRGRKPDTAKAKQAKGETRPGRTTVNVIEFPKARALPDAPDWMNEDGKIFWQHTGELLIAQRAMAAVDLAAFAQLAQFHGRLIDYARRGVLPTAAELAQFRIFCAEFGLTPTSRTRVGGSSNDKKNPFERNGPKAAPRGD